MKTPLLWFCIAIELVIFLAFLVLLPLFGPLILFGSHSHSWQQVETSLPFDDDHDEWAIWGNGQLFKSQVFCNDTSTYSEAFNSQAEARSWIKGFYECHWHRKH